MKVKRINLGFGLMMWLIAILSWQLVRDRLASAARPVRDTPAFPRLAETCAACHDLRGQSTRLGPHLKNIVGRKSGGVPGYPYSAAMRSADLVWTREKLREFLLDPMKTVPNTAMGIAGVPPSEVDALIDYLEADQ
jgi:cytochrome c